MKVTRAVVSTTKNGFVVSVLVRHGIDCWKDSRNHKPVQFADKARAVEYAKTFGEAVYD